jgi:hypothetical protein
MAINTGPRPRARRWAHQVYDAWPLANGIYYPSSMYGGKPAIALFERRGEAAPARPVFHRQLSDPALTNMLLDTAQSIGYGLV